MSSASLELAWTAPPEAGTRGLSYNLYVDGVKLGLFTMHGPHTNVLVALSGLQMSAIAASVGSSQIYVTAVIGSGESSPSNVIHVTPSSSSVPSPFAEMAPLSRRDFNELMARARATPSLEDNLVLRRAIAIVEEMSHRSEV